MPGTVNEGTVDPVQSSVSPEPIPDPRKYSSPSTNESFPTAPTVSNVDSIVSQASGLRAAAMAVTALAAQASAEASAVRKIIATVVPDSNPPSNPVSRPQVDENDVVQEQNRISEIVSSAIVQNVQTNQASSLLNAVAGSIVGDSRQQIMPRRRKVQPIDTDNRAVPDIDQLELDLRRGKGIRDAFFSRITFSVPADDIDNNRIKLFRIFRSDVVSPNFSRPKPDLSLRAMATLSSGPNYTRSHNDDTISMLERRFIEDGVSNDLTLYNPIDKFLGERVITSNVSINTSTDIDPSVANNPQFNDAARLQDQNFNSYAQEEVIVAGSNTRRGEDLGSAHNDDLEKNDSKFSLVVKKNNSAHFKQIFSSSPSLIRGKRVGNRYYFTVDDPEVVFGRQYRYYVVSVNGHMIQSNRSELVVLNVDGIRVPERPKNVFVSSDGLFVTLFITVEDQFVERFEIWKSDHEDSAAKIEFSVTSAENGFSFVDEVANPEHRGGANWVDRSAIPGHTYTYRVYSTDIFGNKSESPFESKITVPNDSSADDKSLTRPSILAEVDSKTKKVKITVKCPDARVKKLKLERRDLTIGQEAFTVPYDSGRIIMGQQNFKHGSYVNGERIQDLDNISLWNGWFDNRSTGTLEFIDRLTTFDRMYQYRVYGVDVLGSKTSYDYSQPVLVFRKPMINVPVNMSSTFVTGTSGKIEGVLVSWQSSSLDVSSEDKLGSQTDLADTSIRTLYQLERQKTGERWLHFNMTEHLQYFDPVVGYSGTLSPEYRPPFLELNEQYNYRVQAVLSGGYISNKTPQISVFVGNSVSTPSNFNLTTPNPRIRPFFVMLNWDTPTNSGIVDHWEIERTEINNFAASRLNTNNPQELKNIQYKPFRTVYRESSRFISFWYDAPIKNSQIITGQHYFLDAKIVFGNTYFYRIRAVDSRGNSSGWVYKGMKVTSPSHERLVDEVVSTTERNVLVDNFSPLRLSVGIVAESPENSMALNPGFSTPSTASSLVQVKTRKIS